MEIKAADVMKLRKATNAGMMDCKHELQEASTKPLISSARKVLLLQANVQTEKQKKDAF